MSGKKTTKIRIEDRSLSIRWRAFTFLTHSLVPVSLVLGAWSAYNVYRFLASRQDDVISLTLWALILLMCVLHIVDVIIFRALDAHYWERERQFNTLSIVTRTLASGADAEKQAASLEKKAEIVAEVTRKVAEEAKTQIQEAVDKGFSGMRTYFAQALRDRGYTQERGQGDDLLAQTLRTMHEAKDGKDAEKSADGGDSTPAPAGSSDDGSSVPVDPLAGRDDGSADRTEEGGDVADGDGADLFASGSELSGDDDGLDDTSMW